MGAYQIMRGTTAKPLKAALYGVEGVGKTTFAAKWPGAVFIDVEDGSGHYDVARMPRPDSWSVLLDEVRAAATMPEVGTLVVDTVDAAEALCVSHVLAVKKWGGIEDAGYGKGYTYLAEEFGKLLTALDDVVAAGKNVLVLCHAQIKKFEQPDELGAYDRWELKLQKKCAPLVKEWCDLLLFANYKTDTMKDEQTKKYKAAGGKRRVMYASHTAAYDAKNRLGLPDSMPFEFDAIADKVSGCKQANENGKEEKTNNDEQPKEQQKPDEPEEKEPEPKPRPEEPKREPKAEEAPEFAQLRQLMADYGVNAAQLRDAVGSRKNNPYTDETHIYDYDPEFVRGVLLAHWEAIVETVKQRSNPYDNDIPF